MGIELMTLALIAVLLGCFGWQLARNANRREARRTPEATRPHLATASRSESPRPRVPTRRRRDRSSNTPGHGPGSGTDIGSFGYFGGFGSDHGGGGAFCDSGGGCDSGGAAERGSEFWVHRVRSRRGLSPIENFGGPRARACLEVARRVRRRLPPLPH